jgi:hypothetical protein
MMENVLVKIILQDTFVTRVQNAGGTSQILRNVCVLMKVLKDVLALKRKEYVTVNQTLKAISVTSANQVIGVIQNV